MNDSLNFTLIQSKLHWEDHDANLAMFESKIKNISEKKEIVVMPEMFTTGFSMHPARLAEEMDGETFRWMKRVSCENKIILTGSCIIAQNGQYFNRLIWMQPNGEYGVYDKRHLFTLSGEDKEFSPGEKKLITQVKGWKICTQICYDLRFPVWSRQTKENPYDVLLYVANWPERRIHAWKTLLQARAIENQCFVIAVNRVGEDGNGIVYSGQSCVINPMGEVQYCKTGEEDILTITLYKNALNEVRERFQFLNDGDGFVITS